MLKNIASIIIFITLSASFAAAEDVKDASLAGSWYPRQKTELALMLEKYINDAAPERLDGSLLALISPHAGYQFSGPVAAYGFKLIKGRPIKTVIVIGFSHKRYFDGIAVCDKGIFRTPLGDVKIDEVMAKELVLADKRIRSRPDMVFDGENSVELQVPFIQIVLPEARIVPMAFGKQSFEDASILSEALAKVLKDRKEYLIVASTDMSHYHSYGDADAIDKHAMELLKKMKAKELYDEAKIGICELCGIMPVTTVLLTAEKLGFDNMRILKYANSGDTFGNKESVVGYVSAAVYRDNSQLRAGSPGPEGKGEGGKSMLNNVQRGRLLEIARESITSFVKEGKRKKFTEKDAVLNEPMGVFVTLHEGGELRGCIGNIIGQAPLYQSVADMAIEAATGDPRFPRLSTNEIDKIMIEISVLSVLKRVSSTDEITIPGHGVLVRRGFRSGVYLPQVADETGWGKEEFMTSLCAHKAALPPDAWKDPSTEVYVFSAEVFGEKEVKR